MKVLIVLIALVYNYINAIYFMDYYENPFFKLSLYVSLGMLIYPFFKKKKTSKRYA